MSSKSGRDVGIVEYPKDSGKWWAAMKDRGKQSWRRAASKSHSRELYHQMCAARARGKCPPEPERRPATFDELLAGYRAAKERAGKSIMRTDIGYRRLLERFGGRAADSMEHAEVEEWYAELMDTMSVASASHHLQLFRALLLRAVANHKLWHENVPTMKLENRTTSACATCSRMKSDVCCRACLLCSRMWRVSRFRPACAKSELLNLRWPEVDFATDTIWVREVKSLDSSIRFGSNQHSHRSSGNFSLLGEIGRQQPAPAALSPLLKSSPPILRWS